MKNLIVSLVWAMALHTGITNAAGNLDGNSYSIKVTDSSGSFFDDCMRFDGEGTMTLDGLPGVSFAYDYDRLGELPNAWLSTMRPTDPFSLSFHGQAVLNAQGNPVIRGYAINSENLSFKFSTYKKKNVCSSGAASKASSTEQHWKSVTAQ